MTPDWIGGENFEYIDDWNLRDRSWQSPFFCKLLDEKLNIFP